MTLPRIPVWVRTALVAAAFAALAPTLTTACASVCTDDEEQACTDTYNACISAAAAAADLTACQKCVDDYCGCFDDCGTDCNADSLSNTCASP